MGINCNRYGEKTEDDDDDDEEESGESVVPEAGDCDDDCVGVFLFPNELVDDFEDSRFGSQLHLLEC